MTRDQILKHLPLIIGGPCSVSSADQIFRIAKDVQAASAHALRAQLWKPRTKPDSFQGVGDRGLPWVKKAKDQTGLLVAMEVLSPEHIKKVEHLADILWVGARNMQNYDLLRSLKSDDRPVILKRGLIATISEWVGAAEYIGLDRVIMCERGIRTGADCMRFTLDFNAVLAVKHDHHLPVIVDPSHSPGRRDMVPYLAEAAIALGADGLVIETHYDPSAELVDKDQTITTSVFARLVKECNDLYQVVQKPNWARL